MSYQDIPAARTNTHLANGETKLFDLKDLLEFRNSKGALNKHMFSYMFEKIQANVKANLYPDYIPKINKVPKGMSKKHLDLSALVGGQISG